MNFRELLIIAKDKDVYAISEIYVLFRPLLKKNAMLNGVFDEDLYQELWLTLLKCIRMIKI